MMRGSRSPTLLFALRSSLFTLCSSPFALHPLLFALCSLLFALCSSPLALRPLLFALCSSPFALRPLLFALCSSPFALHPLPFALCSSPFALCPLLSAPLPFASCLWSLSFLNRTLLSNCARFLRLNSSQIRLYLKLSFRKSAARTFIFNTDSWRA